MRILASKGNFFFQKLISRCDHDAFSLHSLYLSLCSYGRKEGFRLIYEFGHWGEDGGRSGDGSSLEGSNSDSQFLLQVLSRYVLGALQTHFLSLEIKN
jgi:hypothetical protein